MHKAWPVKWKWCIQHATGLIPVASWHAKKTSQLSLERNFICCLKQSHRFSLSRRCPKIPRPSPLKPGQAEAWGGNHSSAFILAMQDQKWTYLLSCRTQGISHSSVQYSLNELHYTFIHSWLLSGAWLFGLALAKLQMRRLKIALFGAMNFRNKIVISDDTVWVTHVDTYGEGLFSDGTYWWLFHQDTTLLPNSPLYQTQQHIHPQRLGQVSKGLLILDSEGTTTRLVTPTKSWPTCFNRGGDGDRVM